MDLLGIAQDAAVPMAASLFGALTGGVISSAFYWWESRRHRSSESVQFASDVISGTFDLRPVTGLYKPSGAEKDDERAADTKKLPTFGVRRALFGFAAVQAKPHRAALRREFDSLIKALRKFPKDWVVPRYTYDVSGSPGAHLIFALGHYRNEITATFELVPDIAAPEIVERLARARTAFEHALEDIPD